MGEHRREGGREGWWVGEWVSGWERGGERETVIERDFPLKIGGADAARRALFRLHRRVVLAMQPKQRHATLPRERAA